MSVGAKGIRENLQRIRERVECAASRAGRRAEEITLVAVSKTFPADAIRDAFDAGLRHFGENRVQEWESKHASLSNLDATDRKSTRLNSSHGYISYAVFCLKKKKKITNYLFFNKTTKNKTYK